MKALLGLAALSRFFGSIGLRNETADRPLSGSLFGGICGFGHQFG